MKYVETLQIYKKLTSNTQSEREKQKNSGFTWEDIFTYALTETS